MGWGARHFTLGERALATCSKGFRGISLKEQGAERLSAVFSLERPPHSLMLWTSKSSVMRNGLHNWLSCPCPGQRPEIVLSTPEGAWATDKELDTRSVRSPSAFSHSVTQGELQNTPNSQGKRTKGEGGIMLPDFKLCQSYSNQKQYGIGIKQTQINGTEQSPDITPH